MAPRVPLLRKQLIAVVDGATTMVCLDAAGQIRLIQEPFHTLAGDYQHPPFHRWCRSTIAPFLDGFIAPHRGEANDEINRRPLAERRKGPTGVGARIPPPPHDETYQRRGDHYYVPTSRHDIEDLLPELGDEHAATMRRYLDDDTFDDALRDGDLTPEHEDLQAALDRALLESTLNTQITAFTALVPSVARRLEIGDIVQDDSYLAATLDPTYAATRGHPVALAIPAGHNATRLDPTTQRILLPRRHAWRLIALGVILIAVLL